MCAPRVLLLSSVLMALGAAGAARAAGAAGAACAADDYCCQLENIAQDVLREATADCTAPQHFNTQDTALSAAGAAARVELAPAAGAAAAAATHVLHALLRRVLRLAAPSVRRAPRPVHAFCADQPPDPPRSVLTVSIASAWRDEQCGPREASVVPGAPPGSLPPALAARRRALPLGPGAVPLARRLFVRATPAAAAAAAAACAADWRALAAPSCGFLNTTRVLGDAAPREWPKCTCPEEGAPCVTVLVVREGAGRERALLEALCRAAAAAAAPPLRLAALPHDPALRAALLAPGPGFLFLDYELWADAPAAARVRAAPPLPCAGACDPAGAESLLVADAGLLMQYAPRVLSLAYRFRPAPALLRAALAPPGPPERAACRAAVQHRAALVDWFRFCEPRRALLVVPCLDRDSDDAYHERIVEAVDLYWTLDKRGMPFDITFSNLTKKIKPCNDTAQANKILKEYTNEWMWTWTAGMVVQSAAGAEALARAAREHRLPLVLAEAPAGAGTGAGAGAAPRAAAAPAPALARAVRSVLRRCGWRRVALLREGTGSQVWEELLSMESLVTHEQELDARRPERALAALRALDARVVLLAAGAQAARAVLAAAAAAAAARGPRPAAWLVLGGAADWRPPPGFAYVALSGAWRGGSAGGGPAPGGSARLRARLDAALGGRWAPLAAPLVDALLLLMTGVERSLREEPRFHNDPHSLDFNKLVFQEMDVAIVEGVTHTFGREPPFIFVHHWSANGSRLLGAWPDGEAGDAGAWPDGKAGDAGAAGALCGAARDAAVCRTARVGDAFAPHCLDGAIAVAACALALAPPALWAAAAARRARLRRRDRAVELRLLARRAPSVAAVAALAGHAVPRAAVELLDRLGRGSSGEVWLAVLRLPGRPPLAVAAKAPRADGGAEAEAALLCEAALLAALRHEHVVRLAGACLGPAPLALLENAFHGDLRGYLRARRPAAERARAGEPEPEAAHVAAPELTRLAREAAAALGYLAHARLVHRDVRAANCLVDARRSLKLADFGMARRTDDADAAAGEYLCRRRGLFPVLCMAPESLAGGVFTAASDVWALGVLLLELATLGARPYGAWSAARVLRHVREGGRPPLPPDAAPATRALTAACWRAAAAERPSAAELVAWLAAHPRALRPALEAPALPADPLPATGDGQNVYFEEWTTPEAP